MQVKVLRESGVRDKAGALQSKGIAFAQFSSQEHALCALRELNNNPAAFGDAFYHMTLPRANFGRSAQGIDCFPCYRH